MRESSHRAAALGWHFLVTLSYRPSDNPRVRSSLAALSSGIWARNPGRQSWPARRIPEEQSDEECDRVRIMIAGPPKAGNVWLKCILGHIYESAPAYQP